MTERPIRAPRPTPAAFREDYDPDQHAWMADRTPEPWELRLDEEGE